MAYKDGKTSIRVLVVDRDRLAGDAIRRVERNGSLIDLVGEAGSIDQALSLIGEITPDIVLLDAGAAEPSSLGRIAEITATSPLSRILVMVNSGGDEVGEAALTAGAHGLLVKTRPAETLLLAIKKIHDGELWFDRKLTSRVLSRVDKRDANDVHEKAKIDTLTKRELEITRLIAIGLVNKDIARRLVMSEKTVRNHLSTIYSKMGVTNRLGLALLASKNGLGS